MESSATKLPTIYDIARESGVSLSTVSRVLSNKTPVSPEKYKAVMQAIEVLGYTPNIHAQNLAQGRSNTIGVVIPVSSSPYYGEILMGLDDILQATPYRAVIASARAQSAEEEKVVELLSSRRVDALVVLGGHLPTNQLRELAAKMPLITVGRSVAGLENYCLQVDNFQGAYKATRYLLERGHRRIAHITGSLNLDDALERQRGYFQALQDAGIEIDSRLVVEGDYREQSGLLGVESLLTRGVSFSAIFLANDQMAWGARLALHRHSIRVPEDISLIGFDDLPSSAYATPPLTSIRVAIREMGQVAAKSILSLLNGEEVNLSVFPVTLVERESVSSPV